MSSRRTYGATIERERERERDYYNPLPREREYEELEIVRRRDDNMAVSRPSRERDYEEVDIVRRRDERPTSRPGPRGGDYEELEIVRLRDNSPDPPPSTARSVRGGGDRDWDEIDIIRHREVETKAPPRPRDRVAYDEAEHVRRRQSEPQLNRSTRRAEREVEELEIIHRRDRTPERPRRAPAPAPAPVRERERDWDEVEIIRHREQTEKPRRGGREREVEELEIIRRRDDSPDPPPQPRRAPPTRSRDYEELEIIRRRDATPEPPPQPRRAPPTRDRSYEELEIIRRRDHTPERPTRRMPVRERERSVDEVDIIRLREERTGGQPEFLREDYGKTEAGALVVREREREIETFAPAPRRRSPETTIRHEEIVTHHRHVDHGIERVKAPSPAPPVHQEIITHHRQIDHGIERVRPPSPAPPIHQEIITHHRQIDHGIERVRPPSPAPPVHQEIITHHRHVDHPLERVKQPTPPPVHQEVVVHHRHVDHGMELVKPPTPPPIHQEIIHHHRHIDHGLVARRRSPSSSPSPPPPPARKTVEREVDIHKRVTKNGREIRHDDEHIYERKTIPNDRPRRARSVGADVRASASARVNVDVGVSVDADIAAEAEYYTRKAEERGFVGEAYNGATRDWTIVDVPPGTERVRMDGVGGASQEITWQRYNGVRRAKFIPEQIRDRDVQLYDNRADRSMTTTRRFVAERETERDMWTEITKDLVVREALEVRGYEFDETEFFFYVMDYLRYEDVLDLVNLTSDIRRSRHDRVREIQWERDLINGGNERPSRRGIVDEERVVEREVVYEGRRPPPRYLR